MTTDKLDALEKIGKEATGDKWDWSYAAICAKCEKGHSLNISHEDEPPVAVVAHIAVPDDFSGDDITSCGEPECVANAQFITTARNHWQPLIDVAKVAKKLRSGQLTWYSAEKQFDAALKKLEDADADR